MILIDLLYMLFLLLAIPFWIKYLFKKTYRRIIKKRFVPALAPMAEKTIWIHAVSVGEARSVKSLISELIRQFNRKVILTVTTPTGYEFARKEYPGITVIPAPLDFSFVIRRFIKAINPEIILFNELELWPNWIYVVKRRAIPMILINGRISEIAFKKYVVFSHLVGRFLSRMDSLIVQTNTYRERFRKLKIPEERIIVCGNIKADEAYESSRSLPDREQVFQKLGLPPRGREIVVIASSHHSDEKLLIPAIARAKGDFLFILVPRHPRRVPQIISKLDQYRIPFRIFSHGAMPSEGYRILIIDQVGMLFEIIGIAAAVYMGGACDRRIGGHNLYEPAAQGKWIIGGAHFQNFADIGQALVAKGVYLPIHSSEELSAALEKLPQIDLERIRNSAIEEVHKRRGSVQCIIRQIQRLVTS